jgi:hypothetical protein
VIASGKKLEEKFSGRLEVLETFDSCTSGCSGCHFSARYDWAKKVSNNMVHVPVARGTKTITNDHVLTHAVFGVVAFFARMLAGSFVCFT